MVHCCSETAACGCVLLPVTHPPRSPGERPVEQARPNTETDEQLQLELALRISKEEAEKENRIRCVGVGACVRACL